MTYLGIIETFTCYGADVVALAALTALVTQLLKLTVLKSLKKKYLTFLPFLLGILFYAVYTVVANLSFRVLLSGWFSVIEHGLTVGAAATFIYVLYEQFVRGKGSLSQSESVTAALVGGYVPCDSVEEAAKAAVAAFEVSQDAKEIEAVLGAYKDEDVTEQELSLLAALIADTLSRLSVT